MRLPQKYRQTSSKVSYGQLFSPSTWHSIIFLLYLGLGEEGKRVLGEFSGTTHTEPMDAGDPEPMVEDAQLWEALGQEGTTQGFIDDIQGLLDGK